MTISEENHVAIRPIEEIPHQTYESKYGIHFANVAVGANIDVIATLYHTPKANAICERFIGSVRAASA